MSEIPGPKRLPFIGTTYTFKPWPGAKVDQFNTNQRGRFYEVNYGQIAKSHLPGFLPGCDTIITLLDPKDFKIVFRNEGKYPQRFATAMPLPLLHRYRKERDQSMGLIFSNQEEWWRMRQPVNKVMMRANAALPYLDLQSPIGDQLVETLKRKFQEGNGRHPKVMQDVFCWALESICAVVYDHQIGFMDPNLSKESWQRKFIDSMDAVFDVILTLCLHPKEKIAEKLNIETKAWKTFRENLMFVDATTLRLIEEAKDRFDGSSEEENSRRFLPQLLNIETLEIKDKLPMIHDMMFAALETITYTVFKTLFHMAKYPHTQDRLHEELMRHVGPPGSFIMPTALSNLHYLKACVKECQRLEPIAPQNGRVLPIDVIIKGYRIPAGTQLLVEHEYVATSPKYFKDPLEFQPERWLRTPEQLQQQRRGGEGSVDPFIVLPFGFGPRMCIGRRFAEQELWIGISKIIHSFKVSYDGDKLPLRLPGLDKHQIKLDFVFEER